MPLKILFLLFFFVLAKNTIAAAAEATATEEGSEVSGSQQINAASVLEQTCAIYIIDGKEIPDDLSAMETISPKAYATGTLVKIPHPSDPDIHKLTIVTVAHLVNAKADDPVYFCQIRLNILDDEKKYALLYKKLIRFDAGAFGLDDQSDYDKCIEDPANHPDLAILGECMNPSLLETLPKLMKPAGISTSKILEKDTPLFSPRVIKRDITRLAGDPGFYIGHSIELCYIVNCSSVEEDFKEKLLSITSDRPSEFAFVPGNSGSGLFSKETAGIYLKGIATNVIPKPETITSEQISSLKASGHNPGTVLCYLSPGIQNVFYLLGPEDLERIQRVLFP